MEPLRNVTMRDAREPATVARPGGCDDVGWPAASTSASVTGTFVSGNATIGAGRTTSCAAGPRGASLQTNSPSATGRSPPSLGVLRTLASASPSTRATSVDEPPESNAIAFVAPKPSMSAANSGRVTPIEYAARRPSTATSTSAPPAVVAAPETGKRRSRSSGAGAFGSSTGAPSETSSGPPPTAFAMSASAGVVATSTCTSSPGLGSRPSARAAGPNASSGPTIAGWLGSSATARYVPPRSVERCASSTGTSGTSVTSGFGFGVPYAGVNRPTPPCGGHSFTVVTGNVVAPYRTVPENATFSNAIVRSLRTSSTTRFDGVRKSAPSRTTMLSGWFVCPISK